MLSIRIIFLVLSFLFLSTNGFPAEKPGALSRVKDVIQPAEKEKAQEDPLGRSTPQGTVLGFLKSATQGDYARALQYLDTKKKGSGAQKLIHDLQVLLERGFSGKMGMLSSKPEGNLEDGLSPDRERIGVVETPSGSLAIFLVRMRDKESGPIWVFSTETLSKIPEAYEELETFEIESYLPKFLVNTWILWFPLWRWLVILLIIPVAFILATLLTRFITSMLSRYSRQNFVGQGEQVMVQLTGPIRILILATTFWVVSLVSQSIMTSAFWAHLAATLSVIAVTWMCMRLIDISFDIRERHLVAASSDKISLIHLGRKLAKLLAVTIGVLFIFYIAGINLTAVLAGLGVGGIAVALAAQKTLENLISGVTIVSDQPIRVGDFCKAGEYQGTVQAVGLRSTRIRTLERTIVSIPNGQLATMSLENFSLRDKIWFHHNLSLRYETTADQLRFILAGIRGVLYGHPKVESTSARVRFIGFGNSSLNLEIFAYVLEAEYPAFLPIQEDLLLRIMDIVEKSGSGFAFPSQTTYVARDCGLNAEKTQTAISQVREWREKGEMPFPDFSGETIEKINNKIEYPPPESAQKKNK